MGNERGEILKSAIDGKFKKLTLNNLFSICRQNEFACAVYQLPEKNERHLIIDLSAGGELNHLQIDEMGSGFIFHPFSSDRHPVKFIHRDIHFAQVGKSGFVKTVYSSKSEEELDAIFFKEKNRFNQNNTDEKADNLGNTSDEKQKFQYIELIRKTINEIKNGDFQKAVIARNKNILLPKDFIHFDFFETLCDTYENSFAYIAYLPDTGMWLGATPETLIKIDTERQFQTTALAATQPYPGRILLEDTTWSQKDIEEQAMVSRYIVNCFKKIRLREFEEVGPRTHLSGNLVHLKTDYKVDMDRAAFPNLGSVMLELLHPTSAVCGMPKEESLAFILANEGFDREYYSGFLGPINIENETNIFVNLRCMKIVNKTAKLFSGAGIISNSNPEKEWTETEIKMDTLLKVLSEMY